MNNKRIKQGFTLIELLVVVLIIGILAAVALPQYQKAVEKSRATEVITLLNAMDRAQQLCVLEQGDSEQCLGPNFFEKSMFEPPTPLLDNECLDTPPCFRVKNWEFWSDDLLYAGQIENGELTERRLSMSTAYPFDRHWPLICAADEGDNYCSVIGVPTFSEVFPDGF